MSVSIVFFDFDKICVEDVVSELLHLPDPIKPIIFSEDDKKPKNNKVSDTEKLNDFIKDNTLGFNLYAEQASFDISLFNGLSKARKSSVFLELLDDSHYPLFDIFLMRFAALGVDFGFAGEWNEYIYRNNYSTVIGLNHISTWVGRDFRKYIPGLYRSTYISRNLAEEHNVDIKTVRQKAEDSKDSEVGTLLRFYDNPKNWKKYANDLDDLCSYLDGVFSIKDVNNAVSEDMSYPELRAALKPWK